jgi:hypothetical protein
MRKFRFTTIACVTVYRDYEITASDEAGARRQAEAILDGSLDIEPVNSEESDGEAPVILNDEVDEITD